MRAVECRRHRGDALTVDDEPIAARVDPVARAGNDGFQDIPVRAAVPRTRSDIRLRRRGYLEVNDITDAGVDVAANVQARLNAWRGVDDDLPVGKKR